MPQSLNATAFATAAAIVAAILMLLLGILGNLGIYTGAVQMMQEWHLLFSLSVGGIIGGVIEAAVLTFVFCWGFIWFYNRLLGKLPTHGAGG